MLSNKYRPSREPKLRIYNEHGKFVNEYIPTANLKLLDWFRGKYLVARNSLGMGIYYWHIRYRIEPYLRKQSDLEFIDHVMKDHNQKPDNRIERRHYKKAWNLYGYEMKFLAEEIGKDADTNWSKDELQMGHPYAYAYHEHWFSKNPPDVETITLYHGISLDEYIALKDLVNERALKRVDEHIKKHKLDPKTGLKLKAKKRRKSKALAG